MTGGGHARVVNAMSVDVEEYFHANALAAAAPRAAWDGFESRVVPATSRLLDLFADRGVRATFFVLGWVARRHPSLVTRIAAEGHEVASHGDGHDLVYDLSPAQFASDVRRAKHDIEDIAGQAVVGYRAPSYSITHRSLWALDVLLEEGYRYDASIFPVHHDRYGIPDAPRHPYVMTRPAGTLAELPPATVRVGGINIPVAGGGYFRLLPYGVTRWGIARVNAVERQPVVFYLHPWEVDPGQPRLSAGWLSRVRHYRNLDQTERRLVALLDDFRFGPMRDMLGRCATTIVPSAQWECAT